MKYRYWAVQFDGETYIEIRAKKGEVLPGLHTLIHRGYSFKYLGYKG